MLKKLLATLAMLCLLAAPALANTDVYEDHGWPEDWRFTDYPGFYTVVQQEPGMVFRLPDGWTEVGYSGSVAAYESADGRMRLAISWLGENAGEYESRIEDLPEYRYWQYSLTNGDVDTMTGVKENGIDCICSSPDYENTLIFSFELSDMGADFEMALHMIASIGYR